MIKGQNQQLMPRHFLIMRMQVQGLSRKDIAEATGLSEAGITLIQTSDIYKAEFAKLNSQANNTVIEDERALRAKIRQLSIYGIDQLEELLKSKETSAKVKADIVFDLLDRDGMIAPKAEEKKNFADDYATQLEAAYRKRKALAEANASVSTDLDPAKTFISFDVKEHEAPKREEEAAA